VIRYRFDEPTVQRLSATQWWLMDDETLRRLGPHFNNVSRFLEVIAEGTPWER
jgi:hypothetical protein